MKNTYKISTALVALNIACVSQRDTTFELPAEMLPHVKTEYVKQCETGERLYTLNCGGCHNLRKGRKQIVPDFKEEDLKGYELRIANARHEKNMPDSLVSEEELSIIMTFLRYKKKSGISREDVKQERHQKAEG